MDRFRALSKRERFGGGSQTLFGSGGAAAYGSPDRQPRFSAQI
jgi:hypothetical protein